MKQIDYNGMDTKIEKKSKFSKKMICIIIGSITILSGVLWITFRVNSSSMNVNKDGITISTVQKGEFNDYIRVVGQVIPDHIIYLDAIEGGRVEERLIEEGTQVKAGDIILRLSNPLLNIGILQSEANLAYQENELRNTRLNMEQEHLSLKQERITLNKELIQKQRRFQQYSHLFQKNLISREDYLQSQEDYNSISEQVKVLSLTESEKKKLSLVVALSCDAKVYIFDEPLLNLTDADKEIFFEQIKELKNCAVILTGNNKEDFEDIANTFIYLSNKEMAHIEANEKYKNFNQKRYSFILTKQPNFAGKVIKENKNIDVLIEEKKVLFPKVSENELEEILKLLVEKKITIYSAGFKENGIEQVAENLKKYFKDEK